jgi:hypothetical protein
VKKGYDIDTFGKKGEKINLALAPKKQFKCVRKNVCMNLMKSQPGAVCLSMSLLTHKNYSV